MPKRRLPIGIQTFRKIWQENCYYVDKTAYIQRLLDEGTHYFLSRPRRFGKSLFLDTLKELFEGNEPLFAGLYIRDRWDPRSWSKRCSNAASVLSRWTGWRAAASCYRLLTWTTWRPRPCCFRRATSR